MSQTAFADYEAERDHFRGLLSDVCDQRILLMKGESGMGKTSLVDVCLREAQNHDVVLCPVDFKSSAMNSAEILSTVTRKVGWDGLPRFHEHLTGQPVQVQVADNRMLGTQQHIDVALQVHDPQTREQRLAAMTDALFDDLTGLSRPLLLAMDTFEGARVEVRDWVAGPLLARVADTPRVRVLLAGQEIPETTIEWSGCCHTCELYGVPEAEHWLPVLEAMDRVVPVESPRSWLAGVCFAFEGRPSLILQAIRKLPERRTAP